MGKIVLSSAEARQVLAANPEADNLPFRVINQAGQLRICNWINQVAITNTNHTAAAYYTEAEKIANDAGVGESIILEMPRHSTMSGVVETTTLADSHFDWQVTT